MSEFFCKVAETQAELEAYYAIRHLVFVEEQALFNESDRDEHDDHAIHLIAVVRESNLVVGAVRCYEAEAGIWYGGRLAVHPLYRKSSIGAQLCELAETSVIEQGCHQFLAYIQTQNVSFFERLKWRSVGEPVMYCGRLHQLMSASLAAARQPVTEYAKKSHG